MLPIAIPETPPRGTRLLITDSPATADGTAWCTPTLAAWLVQHGHAIALVDEHTPDPRQWLHLPAAPELAPSEFDRLVDALFAERFSAPRVPFRSVRAAAQGTS